MSLPPLVHRPAPAGRRVTCAVVGSVLAAALAGCSVSFSVGDEDGDGAERPGVTGDPALVRDGLLVLDFTEPPTRAEVGLVPGADYAMYSGDDLEAGEFPVRVLLPQGDEMEVTAHNVTSRSRDATPEGVAVDEATSAPEWTHIAVRYDSEAEARTALVAHSQALGIRWTFTGPLTEHIHHGREDATLSTEAAVSKSSQSERWHVWYNFGHDRGLPDAGP